MKNKYNYLPFIIIFIICIIVISFVNSFLGLEQQNSIDTVQISDIDSSQKDWFIQKTENNERPTFPTYVEEYVQKYKIFVLGRMEKEIYISFNCGYEFNNYTSDVLDVLKEEKVQGAFFVTGGYLRDNPELINRMIKEGHIVGNHGNTHAGLEKLKVEEIKKEILDFESSYEEVTGLSFEKKYFRPASGVYTEQVLSIAKELGYTTVFWSMAYKDWETEHQPGKEKAYSNMMNHAHNGGIFMLHTVSESNKSALSEVIGDLKEKGYQFRSLEEFPR